MPSSSRQHSWERHDDDLLYQAFEGGDGPCIPGEEERLEFVKTFETLLSLCSFFDLVSEGKYSDALSLIDSVDMVPNTTEDVQRLAFRAKQLDPCLRKTLDALLLQTMECTEQVYLRHKDERPMSHQQQSAAKQEVQNQVQQGREYVFHTLKARAQALVLYAVDIEHAQARHSH